MCIRDRPPSLPNLNLFTYMIRVQMQRVTSSTSNPNFTFLESVVEELWTVMSVVYMKADCKC